MKAKELLELVEGNPSSSWYTVNGRNLYGSVDDLVMHVFNGDAQALFIKNPLGDGVLISSIALADEEHLACCYDFLVVFEEANSVQVRYAYNIDD